MVVIERQGFPGLLGHHRILFCLIPLFIFIRFSSILFVLSRIRFGSLGFRSDTLISGEE